MRTLAETPEEYYPPGKQPKALYLLFAVHMWECFSYYGMRSILVLYMINKLDYSDFQALGVYAVYISLAEGGGIVGGYLADRILGLRYSIGVGAAIISLGHFTIALCNETKLFYLGLGFIVVGSSLFRVNCTTLLGEYYHTHDPRRDPGFTFFYIGISLGGFLSALVCGYLGEKIGWKYGFMAAGFGMLIGLMVLLNFHKHLGRKGLKPKGTKINSTSIFCLLFAPVIAVIIYYQEQIIHYMPILCIIGVLYALSKIKKCNEKEKEGLKNLFFAIFLLILFCSCEEQMGSTLILFAERNIDRMWYGSLLPASSLITISPFTILIIGPIISKYLFHKELKGKPFSPFIKIAFSFSLMFLAYTSLYLGCKLASHNQLVNKNYLIFAFAVMALGELMLGPTVYGLCTKYSPKHLKSMTMGLVMMGFSIGNIISGYIGKFMAITDQLAKHSLSIYSKGFFHLSLFCLAVTILILVIRVFNEKKKNNTV